MSAAFVLHQSPDGQYYFNLVAGNHRIILTSERYTTKAAARKGVDAVRRYAGDVRFYRHKISKRGQSYFVLVSSAGEPVGSGEEYTSAAGARRGRATVKRLAPSAGLLEYA